MPSPLSPQSLSEEDRRLVAAWAADCAERVLPVFEVEAPDDDRARDAIARARAFSRGELTAAEEIRSVDVHLLGRRLYETMLYWEDPEVAPSFSEDEREWA